MDGEKEPERASRAADAVAITEMIATLAIAGLWRTVRG